ncbi:hypothetical protein [Phormidium tenue]|uniref:Uncharacterized protein n=1 Tax=Phormidium tenue NIES-30 TaxID=549789 RepID=A0A1U7J4Z3_9CYAN|nr:hypothetical protein [Phormidium tenue]MBD2232540.1 hypothetical protein [Phormidium tenue FACHB-1052]OKH47680.1 hypothetical protein NIES30_11855 [Phormidium tenue NIES-30]
MIENFGSGNSFRLSIKSLEAEADPRVTHAGVQALCSRITQLSSLEQTKFAFLPNPQYSILAEATAHHSGGEPSLYAGLQCEIPLNKLRVVLRCVGNWLERTAHKTLFVLEIPPSHTITIQTNQARALAQLLILGEALLPPHEFYRTQAEAYIGTFGELTPAAKANLSLVQQRVGLSTEEANELNATAMGPFRTLAEKYQHFRRELLVCKQVSDLDEAFWKVMRAKAVTMGLPMADAQFLKDERLKTLRQEAEQTQRQAEAKAADEAQRQRDQQERSLGYRHQFEAMVIDALKPQSVAPEGVAPESVAPERIGIAENRPDAALFRQGIMAQMAGSDFNRGRLTQARESYHLNPQEAEALEKPVLDELYLLSDLL